MTERSQLTPQFRANDSLVHSQEVLKLVWLMYRLMRPKMEKINSEQSSLSRSLLSAVGQLSLGDCHSLEVSQYSPAGGLPKLSHR